MILQFYIPKCFDPDSTSLSLTCKHGRHPRNITCVFLSSLTHYLELRFLFCFLLFAGLFNFGSLSVHLVSEKFLGATTICPTHVGGKLIQAETKRTQVEREHAK